MIIRRKAKIQNAFDFNKPSGNNIFRSGEYVYFKAVINANFNSYALTFCHKIASAAPPNSSLSSSSQKLTIEDPAFEDLNAKSELDDLMKLYKCVLDVIGKVIGESDLKPLYEQYKRKFDVVLQNDLIKCNEHKDIAERTKFV